ncbi:MAG: radical SAM family heme chaperone HemW [Brevefilum sp.]|jgi:oxygen-independent coproporphyrinogen-3 oxidase
MNHSLYLHIPFCEKRCHYCDFNTTTGKAALIPDYISALSKEIQIAKYCPDPLLIHSVYFGGGTPSLIPISQYESIFKAIHDGFHLTDDCEISLEANPGTLSYAYVSGLKALGFNRISLGVQSTNNFDLERLSRIHDVDEVLNSFSMLREAGFDNINLDLIFGLPWQNLVSWENSLKRAVALQPEHFSLYSLIIEPGTRLHDWHQKGLINPQDQDLEGDMYQFAVDFLASQGYEHYEISNWVKRNPNVDHRCRHNMQYWLNAPYFGFGTGSHGFVNQIRTENEPDLELYIEKIEQNPLNERDFPRTPVTINAQKVDDSTQMKDFMLLGLRLIQDGVSNARFADCFGRSMHSVFVNEINLLESQGLVAWQGRSKDRLRLTKRGILLANRVFMEFV